MVGQQLYVLYFMNKNCLLLMLVILLLQLLQKGHYKELIKSISQIIKRNLIE